ncbi:unnamed protein product [Rhizophagus irregularis]|nr:unnamed protein product [Rhizophagus irregularis]
MQSYSQNDYIHSLLPISQSIQTPIDSSYVCPTNLPISFPSTTPYYSNSSVQLNNCPPTKNSYSFTPYLANANSYSESTHNNMTSSTPMPNFSSSDSRQQENRLYYYV